MKNQDFNPQVYLSALGAGGIAVTPFAIMQYVFPHGDGLVTLDQIINQNLNLSQQIFFWFALIIMPVFGLLHFVIMLIFLPKLIAFLKVGFKLHLADSLQSPSLVIPLLAITMSMNVFIGVVRFFIPAVQENFQSLMLPALIFWIIIFTTQIILQIKILQNSYVKDFAAEKISFNWLVQALSMGMLSVVGSGIAALAKDTQITDTAAFLTLVSASFSIFLTLIGMMIAVYNQIYAKSLPENKNLPAFLNLIPVSTVLAITFFRLGHFLENRFHYHLDPFFFFVIVTTFAFQTWYLVFSVTLIKPFWKHDFLSKNFYLSQWSLICPFIAYSVLGAFTFAEFGKNQLIFGISSLSLLVGISIYIILGYKAIFKRIANMI
jgi:hypothetical protein